MPINFSLPNTSQFFDVIEALHDNVAIVDRQGIMIWVSSSFERTFGITRDQVVGRTTYDLERERLFFPSVAALVLKTKAAVTLTETTRFGQYNIVTGVPLYDADGEVAFVVSYTVDRRYSLKLQEESEKISQLQTGSPSRQSVPLCAISKAMRNIVSLLEKIARVDTNVLVTGESGVGKNVLARIIHQLGSRSSGPFVEINCAGIPGELLESELFGYESGAFTGANAKGKDGRIALSHTGTLFLDEIGELPPGLQTKLLQVIQEKQYVKLGGVNPVHVDFRLIAATNQDLDSLVQKGLFRKDLFFRLNVLPVHVPALRERKEDIAPLSDSILAEMNNKYGTEKKLSKCVLNRFVNYAWPGNIRELRNLIERLVVVSAHDTIELSDLPKHMQELPPASSGKTLREKLEALERQLVLDAYEQCKTTVATAKALGISQPTAARKIARYLGKGPVTS